MAKDSMLHLDPTLCDGSDTAALAAHKTVTFLGDHGDFSTVRTPDGSELRVENSQLERATVATSPAPEIARIESPENIDRD